MKKQTFDFVPFSKKQLKIMTWWNDASPVTALDGIVADGAIRSGKTLSMSLSFVIWALENFDGETFIMCGKTVLSFRRNVLSGLTKMLAANGYEVQERRSDNMFTVKRNDTENQFIIFGGQNEGSQDLVQGITAAGAFFDEVALMPESFVNQATGRCSVEGSKLWFNCNPGSPAHFFKTGWIDERKDKSLLYLHFTMDDNPSLSEKTKARYRAMYSGVFRRRFIMGEWALADGAIYPMFDPDLHVVDAPPHEIGEAPIMRRLWVGIDYGHANPTVFLLIGEGVDNRAYVLREYYHKGAGGADSAEMTSKSPRAYSSDLKEFLTQSAKEYGTNLRHICIDPSAAGFINQLYEDGVAYIRRANNTVLEGISLVSSMIENDRLRVLSCCKHTIEEMSSYAWDSKAALAGEDKPVKVNDHCADALRYGLMDDQKYWEGKMSAWI